MVAADGRVVWPGERRDRWRRKVGRRRRVVLLCEGDVSLFAAPSYDRCWPSAERHPNCPLRLIPGITALAAAAAAALGPWPAAAGAAGAQTTPDAARP